MLIIIIISRGNRFGIANNFTDTGHNETAYENGVGSWSFDVCR